MSTTVNRRHQGALWFDGSIGRYVFDGWELHCGDCFEVCVYGHWQATRIEMSGFGWYLVGVSHNVRLTGLEARSHD